MKDESPTKSSKPGWLYDIASGICAGPASYEQAEAFAASGGKPIRTTLAGCPISYTIRQRPELSTAGSKKTE